MPGALTPGVKTPLNGPTGGGVVQVPFKAGVPPKRSINAKAGVLLQTVITALVPALGGWFTETVTEAVALGQGAVPRTVYVYIPAVVVPGMNTPLNVVVLGAGPVHVPVGLGVLPNAVNRFTLAPPEQRAMEFDDPAFATAFSNTVTTATSAAHGVVPMTV